MFQDSFAPSASRPQFCRPGAIPNKLVASPADRRPEAIRASVKRSPAFAQAPASSPAPGQTGQQQAGQPQTTQQERNRQLRNQQLIDTVEQAYQAGVDNYRAGHLEAAKASFDYAVDQMLSSGLDLKNDPQLSAEFEHIVDAINTLEMDALKQGNGFAPPIEPTPVDVANDVTFPVDPALKAQAQARIEDHAVGPSPGAQ